MTKVLAYLALVDGVGATQVNGYLAQAQLNLGNPRIPDLYWWEVTGVGAFFTHDGIDTAVVLMGRIGNPPTYGALLLTAQGRF